MIICNHYDTVHASGGLLWTRCSKWLVLLCCISIITTPVEGFFSSVSRQSGSQESTDMLGALNRIAQTLESHERHTILYERVAMLEHSLSQKTQNELRLETQVQELSAKIPLLEAEIETIPEMRKDLLEFEAKIEKLVHDYEAKLSTLASEVIRLKKNGARRKDLQTLSDGSDNVLLRVDVPTCPEVGLGLDAERIGDHCLYFSWGTALNWTDAHKQCQSLGGDLSAPEDLLPLKTFLHTSFTRGPSIWLGASYNLEENSNISTATVTSNITGIKIQSSILYTEDLDIIGLPEVTNNRLEGDLTDDIEIDDIQDDESRIILTHAIPLRDEAVADQKSEPNLLAEGSSPRLTKRNLPGSTSKTDADTRLSDSLLLKPVVDFILLKDTVSSVEVGKPISSKIKISHVSKNPSTIDDDQLIALSNTASKITDDSAITLVARDVREALDMSSEQEQEEDRLESIGKAKMNCMLLRQKESLEYELIGQPCNEKHRFVCEFFSTKDPNFKFTPDSLLHE